MTELSQTNKRNLVLLVIIQAVMGAQLSAIFVVGGLAGQSLASNVCFATMTISIIMFGSMTTAPWLSLLMARRGRRFGFLVGAGAGMIAGLLGAYAIYVASFWLLLVSSYFTGIYMSSQGFYRFAATDISSGKTQARAVSWVMAGGLISALIGPQVAKFASPAFVVPFMGVYLSVVILNLIGMIAIANLNMPRREVKNLQGQGGRSLGQMLRTPRIAVAIICAMVSYALMNLVMTATPLAVVGCGHTQGNAADIVMLHVIGMFAPSFVTGHLINRFGVERIVATGLAILALAGLTNLAGITLVNFFGGLILLGVGWNFGFIGATTMLASAHSPEERGRIQGFNDFAVFGLVMIASFVSGGLLNCSGADVQSGWNLVNLAMVPFLALAGGALIWLVKFAPKEA